MVAKKIYSTIILMLTGSLMLAQTYTNGNSLPGIDNFQSKAVQLGFFSSQAPSASQTNSSVNRSVYIQQIGNRNKVEATTRSVASNVNLVQRGNNNEISMNVTAAVIDETVFQNGLNNRFIDLSTKGTLLHKAAIIQNGRNQNLIWYGNNSISDRLFVNMRGNNQTIFIRNIKR